MLDFIPKWFITLFQSSKLSSFPACGVTQSNVWHIISAPSETLLVNVVGFRQILVSFSFNISKFSILYIIKKRCFVFAFTILKSYALTQEFCHLKRLCIESENSITHNAPSFPASFLFFPSLPHWTLQQQPAAEETPITGAVSLNPATLVSLCNFYCIWLVIYFGMWKVVLVNDILQPHLKIGLFNAFYVAVLTMLALSPHQPDLGFKLEVHYMAQNQYLDIFRLLSRNMVYVSWKKICDTATLLW